MKNTMHNSNYDEMMDFLCIKYKEGDLYKVENKFLKCKNVNSFLVHGIRKSKPKISFMIPTYKRNDYILETIASVLKQTEQSVEYEIVIVDNEIGNNELENKLKAFNPNEIAYYQNETNIGMFNNWNKCIELANGEWVLILHDDDSIENNYLNTIIKIIDKNPEIGGIACDYNFMNECSEIKQAIDKKSFLSKLENKQINIKNRDFYWFHPVDIFGLIINRKKAIELGGFDEDWFPVADYKFIINLCKRYGIILTTQKIYNYRIADNESRKVNTLLNFIYFNNYLRKEINDNIRCIIKPIDYWYRKNLTANEESLENNIWLKEYNNIELTNFINGACKINDVLGYKTKPFNIEMRIQKIIEFSIRRFVRIFRRF